MNTEALRLALQARIGARLQLGGINWTLREVLSNPPSLVLESVDERAIQANRHGESHRRVPRTRTVPIAPDVPEVSALLKQAPP